MLAEAILSVLQSCLNYGLKTHECEAFKTCRGLMNYSDRFLKPWHERRKSMVSLKRIPSLESCKDGLTVISQPAEKADLSLCLLKTSL